MARHIVYCTNDSPNNGFVAVYRTKTQHSFEAAFVHQHAIGMCVEAYVSQNRAVKLKNSK